MTMQLFSIPSMRRITLFFQLMLILQRSETWGRRASKGTQNNVDLNFLSATSSSTEGFFAALTFKDVMPDIVEMEEKYDWYHPLLKSCKLQNLDERNILLSYHGNHNLLVKAKDALIPHGTTLVARCPLIGKMKLVGPSLIRCNNGKWNEGFPSCKSTTPADGYSQFIDDHPPTIVANIPNGSAGENSAGELVVRPQSVVHLDCIFYRRLGNPLWRWKHSQNITKKYPFGWAIALEERLWRYRISIFSIQSSDEGEYTCVTPHGHINSIRIIVQTIHCPQPQLVEPPLLATIEGNYAGQKQLFFCPDGYRLQGPSFSECLTSGSWSHDLHPICELIQCPYDIDGADPRLEFDFLNGAGYKSMVKFSCPSGYHLRGPTNATCNQNMNWYPSPPVCEVVECPVLLPPLNGRIIDSGSSHFVGDVVKFSCNRNFHLLGQSDITCMENGTWSHSAPHCQIFCPHPGDTQFGILVPDNTFYEVGTSIQTICNSGMKLVGRKWLVCQQDGTWSSSKGVCVKDVNR